MTSFPVGSLVRCREREWVVLPSEQADILLLRPLGGSEAEACGIYLPLEGQQIEAASFQLPTHESIGDLMSGQLLRDAARLGLRNGAGPFRSLGRLGLRPRPYQLVPLIMALRLEPIRLLIADDVGIGKTIEAGLIVRELIDRGEIRRLTVLCPPHLCDQWQRELSSKFAIEAAIIRSSTIAGLERAIPEHLRNATSVWEYYPFTVTSIDYAKTERNRPSFVQHCPELVIVDEAHTAARPGGASGNQQQRYELLRVIATPERHLVLLTATPHSGIEESFLSLLGLLNGDFEAFNLQELETAQRDALARHFVQRRRADVQQWLGESTPFPQRELLETTYQVADSPAYRTLFEDIFEFAREYVQSTATISGQKVRVRYWTALALLRCVMSSPAAAAKALATRAKKYSERDYELELDDDLLADYVHDRTDQEGVQDVEPTAMVEEASNRNERTRLDAFAKRAEALCGDGDPKLAQLVHVLKPLLKDGYNPIVYCRYIATANYLAEQLQSLLKTPKDIRIIAVTGERSEEERETLVEELSNSPRRLLVATDCLSEGINLQQSFDAVIHYDLPWNPNRLEQREGRVDRYGQTASVVRTVLMYGADNPIDLVVMKVLLRKARKIHSSLGFTVPLPTNSESIMETMIQSLFKRVEQLPLIDYANESSEQIANDQDQQVEIEWQAAVEREKQSRTRFAQRSIKPADVAQELEESDIVLGDQTTIRHFLAEAAQRLNAGFYPRPELGPDVWEWNGQHLPLVLREQLAALHRPGASLENVLLTFSGIATPTIEFVGRNHPLILTLADYIFETALTPDRDMAPAAARSGVIRTDAVQQRTLILVLRVRMLITTKNQTSDLLAEELIVCGFTGTARSPQWLEAAAALALLTEDHQLQPINAADRNEYLEQGLMLVEQLKPQLEQQAQAQAKKLEASHNRVRSATKAYKAKVEAQTPDILGVYVVLPASRSTL